MERNIKLTPSGDAFKVQLDEKYIGDVYGAGERWFCQPIGREKLPTVCKDIHDAIILLISITEQ